jgi:ubiquinone/menaquinone biosynthesis C-methylase UbiE
MFIMKNYKELQDKTHFHLEGLNVEVYDQRFKQGPDPLMAGDIDFYIDYATQYGAMRGKQVLELGSGTGRITWELARYGVDVVGLDLSDTMIQVAERKRAGMPEETQKHVTFIKGDMTDFDLQQRFPLIIIPCRSFQCLLTVEDQIKCLETAREHLEDDGRFILNMFDPRFDPHTSADWQKDFSRVPNVTHPQTGNNVHIKFLERRTNFYEQLIKEFWQYTEVDNLGNVLRKEESELAMRWVTRQEMRHLFALTGFEIVGEYSDFFKSGPVYGKEQVWVVKKADNTSD